VTTRRVFLHVGEPKCGTTYVQEILWRNRAALAAHGIVLPGRDWWSHFRATQDLRGIETAADDPSGSWRGEWDALAAEAGRVRRGQADVVISHELLSAASADQAARAIRSLAPMQVHVVLAVRDISTLLPAEWQETIKHGNVHRYVPWVNSLIERPTNRAGRLRWFWRVHDTMAVLERWVAALPPQQVHVVTVPHPGAPSSLLWERFASVIGAGTAPVDLTATRPNASLGVAEVEMLRRLNRLLPRDLPGWFYTTRVKDQIAQRVLARRRSDDRLQLPPNRRKWAEERSDQLISALKASGYHIVGELGDLRPIPSRSPRARPHEVTDKQMFEAAIDSLAALLMDEYRRVEEGRFAVGNTERAGKAITALRSWASRLPGADRVRPLLDRRTHGAR
jgi:hypothetical protein